MDLLSLPSLLLLLVVISTPIFLLRSKKDCPSPKPDGLGSYPIVGNLPQFIRNRGRFLDWMTDVIAATPTSTYTIHRPGVRGVVTANPANVEHILKNHFGNYPKGPRFISLLEDFLGRGIFNSDGEQWKVQRKTASFEFNTKSLRNFVVDNVQAEVVDRLLPLLTRSARDGSPVDLQDVLERFAFDNVCKVAFDFDPCCLSDDAGKGNEVASRFTLAFRDATNLVAGRFRYAIPRFWVVKRMLGIGSERKLAESIAVVHDFAADIIRSRKKERGSGKSDLLSRFIANGVTSEEFLRDVVISFVLAGKDTTSSALSWFFWLVSTRPDVKDNISKELRSIRAQNPELREAFGFDELKEMPYLHAAISESMRLYPPVPANSTYVMADDVLPDGTAVKKGWFTSYNAYAMGRTEAIWGEDCREYRPERWLDESGSFKPASPFAYPVFHAGPRMCLGKEMAYIQMKSIVACVMERFDLDVVRKENRPEQLLSLTLRMRNGLPVKVKERPVDEVNAAEMQAS